MSVFVCNLCGGDHGAMECPHTFCLGCWDFTHKCECDHDWGTGSGAEVIWNVLDALESYLPDEGELVDHFYEQRDLLPVETISFILGQYDPDEDVPGKELFPPTEEDGKTYNKSFKFSQSFKFAFTTLLDETAKHLNDGEVRLLHGLTEFPDGQVWEHAWLETDSLAIDCGTMIRRCDYMPKSEYYAGYGVTPQSEYSCDEAMQECTRTNSYGPWHLL